MSIQEKYLRGHGVAEAKTLYESDIPGHWQHVLVVPAYGEAAGIIENLLPQGDTLLILVLNRPESESDKHCNDALRQQILSLRELWSQDRCSAKLCARENACHVLLLERDDPLPNDEGVGLARKIGCDAALALMLKGSIASPWIHCSDADAVLPADYFSASAQETTAIALTYPFEHLRPKDQSESQAIDLYEQHLEHYVDGIKRAGSPYAFHTLGSCIAIQAEGYARVRGFPRRAGGEDFYLLNKLAKQGAVYTPKCAPIRLSARLSQRAPFGTGPALRKLLAQGRLEENPLFYDPRCFYRLGEWIGFMEHHGHPGLSVDDVRRAFANTPEITDAVLDLGLTSFLQHAERQCADSRAFVRQFHQWFDGFRSLKFIHALCATWKRLSFNELAVLPAPLVEQHG